MKQVFEHIQSRSAQFYERPLFVYLRDPQVTERERLEFIPWMSHFVMTFADLYHFFLVEEPPRDRYQELVNTHLSEEGTHWKWFLADLTTLGLDPQMRFTDVLRFVWGDATKRTRELAYEMCKLSAGMTSLQKLVMVHAIEATGRVGLEAAVPVGVELEKGIKRTLVYFGQHHLDTERQHTVEESSVHESLEAIPVTPEEREQLFAIVNQVFDHFAGFVDEVYANIKANRKFPEAARDKARMVV